MTPTCWVLGGHGLVGEALQKEASGQQHFKFLGRADFELGISRELPEFQAGDTVIDLIPGPTPRLHAGLSAEEYHHNFTAPHIQLIQYCHAKNVGHYIFLSSGGTVYGQGKPGYHFQETDTLHPISSYGESKVMLEIQVQRLPHYSIIRPSNIFNFDPQGPKQSGVVGVFLQRFLSDSPLDIFGSEEISKDYVSNRDVAHAIMLTLNGNKSGIYNIGSGQNTTLAQIIEAYEQRFKVAEDKIRHQGMANDVTWFALDIRKAQQELGYTPRDQVLAWIKALSF